MVTPSETVITTNGTVYSRKPRFSSSSPDLSDRSWLWAVAKPEEALVKGNAEVDE